MKTFFKLLFSIVALVAIGSIVSDAYDVPLVNIVQVYAVGTAALVIVRLVVLFRNPDAISRIERNLAFGVAVEFWDNYIASNLYKTYEWLNRAKQRAGNVLNSTVVHIPQAGAVPNVVRNRTQFPIGKVNRADSDITYVIDELSSDTTIVKEAEKWELSYAKTPDVIKDHMNELIKRIAQNTLFRWSGKNTSMLNLNAANVKRPAGGGTAGHLLSGATGTRAAVLVSDLQAIKTVIIAQTKLVTNPGKRAFFMSEDFYTELLTDPVFASLLNYAKIGAVFQNGDLISLLGFDIIRTDVMPRFDNSGTPVAKDGLDTTVANAATDNDVIIAVDFDFVHLAKSDSKMFFRADDPDYQGDIMNLQARMGASRERVDQAGVAALVQS